MIVVKQDVTELVIIAVALMVVEVDVKPVVRAVMDATGVMGVMVVVVRVKVIVMGVMEVVVVVAMAGVVEDVVEVAAVDVTGVVITVMEIVTVAVNLEVEKLLLPRQVLMDIKKILFKNVL